MASHGIKDQVAIVGMGCTSFGEHWDKSLDDLIIEAAQKATKSAGIETDSIDAYWFGTSQSAASGIALATPLRLSGKPVTRVENYCATGSESLRQACYAVASGAYDSAMALGAEKVKDSGYQGLNAFPIPTDGTNRTLTAAAMFSLILPSYAKRYEVDEDELRYVIARIAQKNHFNGSRNELAQFRREVSAEKICEMPSIAGRLSVMDCAGVADGAAAAIVVRAEDAHKYTDKPLYVKALSVVAGDSSGLVDPDFDFTTLPECAAAAGDAYAQAGIEDPRKELAMAEVHDCFTIAELMIYEAIGLTPLGEGARAIDEGWTEKGGRLPINPSGGLKSKGHPIGATGVSMHVLAAMQLPGSAGDIQVPGASLAGIFNMGGSAVANYASILEPLR